MKKLFFPPLVAALLLVAVAGCSKDKGKAPVLPDAKSMVIDFSDFSSAKSAATVEAKDIPDPDENFMFSTEIVGVWNKIITEDLAVPVKAFGQVQGKTAKWIADKTWEWSATFTSGTGSYNTRIVGKILSDKTEWEIYIQGTGSPSFAEFVWVTGTSATDGKSGRWVMNHSSAFPEPYLQIDWTQSGTTFTPHTYTYVRTLNNVRNPDPFKTSFIKYESVASTLNGKYTVKIYEPVTVNNFVDVFIEWNSTSVEGRVKAEYKFGNTNWNCWDQDQLNITCPI